VARYTDDSQQYYDDWNGYYPEERTTRTVRSARGRESDYPERTVRYSSRTEPGRGSRRKRKRRGNRTLLFTFVLLALAGIAVLIVQLIFNRRETFIEMSETPIAVDCTYLNTGDGLLYQTDGEIHFYHFTDSKKNYTYGMGASDIRMSGSESMTVVFNFASLQVVGEQDTIAFTGAVKEVECGTRHLAVLRTSENGEDGLWLLTINGERREIAEVSGQYIVDFGFYSVGGEKLWIETLNVNAGTPMTTITSYDVDRNAVTGVMNIYNQLVDGMYITNSSIFVAGTNQIIRYTHNGNKEEYRTMIYGYQPADFSVSSGTATFLLTPRGGDFHSVKILSLAEDSASNKVETYLQLPTEGVNAFIMGNNLVVASRENLYVYSLKGKLQRTATFAHPIDSAEKISDSMLLLASGGRYYLAGI
jgi:hypothetical protein